LNVPAVVDAENVNAREVHSVRSGYHALVGYPRVQPGSGVPIVEISGEIDASNSNDILLGVLDDVPDDVPGLVLDLRHTDYLDSAGIRALFELARRLRARRQQLRLVVLKDGIVRRVLTLTAFTEVVDLHETPADAQAAIATQWGNDR
jgi:anti-anti-sigma factor